MATREQVIRITRSQGKRLVEVYQRVFVAPERQQRQAATVVRQWIVWIDAKCPIKACHRLDRSKQIALRIPAQDQRIDQKRIERERPIAARNDVLLPPHLAQDTG